MNHIFRLFSFLFISSGLFACASSIPKPGDTGRKRAAFQKTAQQTSFVVKGDYQKLGSCYHVKKETEFARVRRIPGNTMYATGYNEKNSFVYTMNNRTIMGSSPLLVIDFKPGETGKTAVTIFSTKGIFSNAFGSPADGLKKELASCMT